MTFITEGDGDPGIVWDERWSWKLENGISNGRSAPAVKTARWKCTRNRGALRQKGRRTASLLTDDATRPQAMDIIRSLIDRIKHAEGAERGKPDVILATPWPPAWHSPKRILPLSSLRTAVRVLVGCGGRI